MNDAGFFLSHCESNGMREKPVSLGKRVLENGFIKKIFLVAYNKIFSWYYS